MSKGLMKIGQEGDDLNLSGVIRSVIEREMQNLSGSKGIADGISGVSQSVYEVIASEKDEFFVRREIRGEVIRSFLTAEFGFNDRVWWLKSLLQEKDLSELIYDVKSRIKLKSSAISNLADITLEERDNLDYFTNTIIEAFDDDRFNELLDDYGRWLSRPDVFVSVFVDLIMVKLADVDYVDEARVFKLVTDSLAVFGGLVGDKMSEDVVEAIEEANNTYTYCVYYFRLFCSEFSNTTALKFEDLLVRDQLIVSLVTQVFMTCYDHMPAESKAGGTLPCLQY